jgi:hypothetical protein
VYMYLYHYSTKKVDVILSRLAQHKKKINVLSKKELRDEELAKEFRGGVVMDIEQISFFFEKIPLDVLRSASFDRKHKAYQKGKKLYVYKVKIENLPSLYWEEVETAFDVWFRTWFWLEDNVVKRVYFSVRRIIKFFLYQDGVGIRRIASLAKIYKGTYRGYFKKWINSKSFEGEKHMYAATVPHILIAPRDGAGIVPEQVTEIIF